MDSYCPHPMHETRYHKRGIHRRCQCHQGANHFRGQSEASHRSADREHYQILHQSRFGIDLSPGLLHFVFLSSRYLIEDTTWPVFTLLGQSIGSMYLAWEAVSRFIPDLFIGMASFGSPRWRLTV